jgi:hypothetical protein
MKSILKWFFVATLSLVVVAGILSLFTLLARPVQEHLSNLFVGYVDKPPVILTEEQEATLRQQQLEEWVTTNSLPEQCSFYISGKVTQNDGVPIGDAEVKIYNSGLYDSGDYRYTDRNGEFSYTEFGTDTCDKEQFYVSVSKHGFQSYFLLAKPDEVINISLTSIFYN